MKLATTLFLPLLSGLLMTVAVSAHDKKDQCKIKHKHHSHGQSSHHHKHHSHHKHHHHHHHPTTPAPTHVPGKKHPLSPNGVKAGLSGQEAATYLKHKISWMNNWETKPYDNVPGDIQFVPECYGFNWSGHHEDYLRFEAFKKVPVGEYPYVIGPNEIDLSSWASAGLIPPEKAAELWEQWIAPWGHAGSVLISPSCAKQRDETWMGPFLKAVKTKPDVVNVHLFSDKVEDIKKVLDHYAQYNLPMWVTEFACINFNHNHKCTQEETNNFIWNAIKIFEEDDRVKAYSYADAASNGDSCQLAKDGHLTESGRTYLAALERFGNKNGGKMRREVVPSTDAPSEKES